MRTLLLFLLFPLPSLAAVSCADPSTAQSVMVQTRTPAHPDVGLWCPSNGTCILVGPVAAPGVNQMCVSPDELTAAKARAR